MRAFTSHSQELEAVAAAGELIAKSTEQLQGEAPVAAFLFASTDYDHQQLLAALHAHWPDLPLVGGTTDGAISGAGFAHDSVLLTLLTGKGLRARVGLGRSLSKDPARAVAQALAASGPQPRLCWTVFAPTTNATAVVRMLQQGVGTECPVVGGLTGDHREYSRMVEFCGTEVLTDSLPVMFLDGDMLVGCGVGTGWFPIGEPKIVTRAADNWVHEIDGKPALRIYEDYWGAIPPSASLGEYPLAVFPAGPDGDYHLRAVLDADRTTGSLRVAGEVLQGAVIRLTEVVRDGLLAGSWTSASNAISAYPGRDPQIAFVFSCAARKWVLGTKAETEIEHLRSAFLGAGISPAFAGGYCFGEIAPVRPGAPSEFHNETCVTVILGR
jgi:hypothetical protein